MSIRTAKEPDNVVDDGVEQFEFLASQRIKIEKPDEDEMI